MITLRIKIEPSDDDRQTHYLNGKWMSKTLFEAELEKILTSLAQVAESTEMVIHMNLSLVKED